MKTVDVRKLACPGPVLKLRDLLDDGETQVIFHVADELARSNVTRFATSRSASVQTQTQSDGSFLLSIVAGSTSTPPRFDESQLLECQLPTPEGGGGLVIQISCSVMGSGDDELGALLLRSLIKTIDKLDHVPNTMVFYNDGVKLCCSGSELLDDLNAIAALGVEILVCGTCLNFFDLAGQLAIGRGTDMLEIGNTLSSAGTIIRP